MNQQVGNEEYGIILGLAHIDLDRGAVLFHNDAVKSQRDGDPLVLFDAAVIMGVQIGDILILIQRILLHIDSGAVDMRAKKVHARLHGLLSDLVHHQTFIHIHRINLVSGLHAPALFDQVIQFAVTCLFNQVHQRIHALALSLAVIQEIHIFPGKCIGCLYLLI